MIRKVVNQSIDLLWGAWQAFFGVALLIGALNALVGLGTALSFEDLVDDTAEAGFVSMGDALLAAAIGIVVFAVSLILTSILIVMVATAARGDRPNAAEALSGVVRRGVVVVGAVLASTVMVFVGLLLFIVPGIWLIVTLMPLLAIVLDGEEGVVGSVRRTFELVRGRWLSVAGLVAILAAINIGLGVVGTVPGAMGFLLSILANAISSMIIATAIWFTYTELRRQHDWPEVI